MMENERKFLSLQLRLAAYNLQERLDRLPDLRVEPNETVVLTADEEELHPHLVRLRPKFQPTISNGGWEFPTTLPDRLSRRVSEKIETGSAGVRALPNLYSASANRSD